MSHSLRVMTLNVAHGARGPMPAAILPRRKILSNLDAIGSVIRAADADVVALQEVDRACGFSGRVDHFERIAEASELPFRIHAPHGENHSLRMRHGHALLSRLPLAAKEHRRFARRLCHDKGFVVATIATDGLLVDVVSVHLEPFSRSIRRSQILELAAALNVRRQHAARPLVVMGDLNCGWTENGVALLADCLKLSTWRAADRLPTYSTVVPLVRFDWILVSRELVIVSHETRSERVSDHAAVVAEIALAWALSDSAAPAARGHERRAGRGGEEPGELARSGALGGWQRERTGKDGAQRRVERDAGRIRCFGERPRRRRVLARWRRPRIPCRDHLVRQDAESEDVACRRGIGRTDVFRRIVVSRSETVARAARWGERHVLEAVFTFHGHARRHQAAVDDALSMQGRELRRHLAEQR